MGLRDFIRDISNLKVPESVDRAVQSRVEALRQTSVGKAFQQASTTAALINPSCSAPIRTEPAVTEYLVPRYEGRFLFEWIDDIKEFKRAGDLDQALALAQACLTEMTNAALQNPERVLEYYVAQVAVIQHKMKDYAGELATIDGWLSLGLPAPREDYRVDLQKRRAKAQQMLAKQRGEDASAYNAEWKRLVELEKAIKNSTYFDAPTTGFSSVPVGVHTSSSRFIPPRERSAHSSAPAHSRTPASPKGEQPRHSAWAAPSSILAAPTFVAVDFETANRTGGVSACQIALVKVHQGVVIDRMSTLIKPPSGFDHFEFTHIHGITARDVRNAPSWHEIAPYALSFSAGLPTYAHNASFDKKVWEDLDTYFRTCTIPSDFFCSYRTAQELIPGLDNYKLPTVTQILVPWYQLNHHNACSDAEACALIIAALQERRG